MGEVIFDIEANGLLQDKREKTGTITPALTRIHCIGLADGTDAPRRSFGGKTDEKVREVLSHLEDAAVLVGHNIVKFDIPALQKVYPAFKPRGLIRDTLVISRLIWSEITDQDFALLRKNPHALPMRLLGRHSLEAWGYRLNLHKGKYDKGWAEWSQEMQDYCERDIEVTQKFWRVIKSKAYSEEAIQLEHDFQDIIFKQELEGFPFDEKAGQELFSELAAKRAELEQQLAVHFPPWEKTTKRTLVPKRDNKTRGYVTGVPKDIYTTRTITFNPRSADHVAERLKVQRQWEPLVFTDTNKVRVDGDVLEGLAKAWPECKLLAEHHEYQKIISMLAEGKTPWLKVVKNGRIHGEVNTNGTVTGRCAHFNPNLGNIPKKGALGKRCRALFTAIPGWKLLGVDASGLELRCMAHYLQPYDGGAYIELVLHGDVHTNNQKAMNLPTRDLAKPAYYAWVYGAGNAKMGLLIGGGEDAGKRMKAGLLKGIPALGVLKDAVAEKAKQTGSIKGVDGRIIPVRAAYSSLNTLLQSAGAVLVKKATVIFHRDLAVSGLTEHYKQVCHIHDEIEGLVREGYEERVGNIAKAAFKKAGEHFKFRCTLDGEWKSGANWRDVH